MTNEEVINYFGNKVFSMNVQFDEIKLWRDLIYRNQFNQTVPVKNGDRRIGSINKRWDWYHWVGSQSLINLTREMHLTGSLDDIKQKILEYSTQEIA